MSEAPTHSPAPAPRPELPEHELSLREELLRDVNLRCWLPGALLMSIGFVVAYRFVEPPPPDRFVIAAGPRDGACFQHAAQYSALRVHVKMVRGDVRERIGAPPAA